MENSINNDSNRMQIQQISEPLNVVTQSVVPGGIGSTPSTMTEIEEPVQGYFSQFISFCGVIVNALLIMIFTVMEVIESVWNFFAFCPIQALKEEAERVIQAQLATEAIIDGLTDATKIAVIIRIDQRVIELHRIVRTEEIEAFKQEAFSKLQEFHDIPITHRSSLFIQTILVDIENRKMVNACSGLINGEAVEDKEPINSMTGLMIRRIATYVEEELEPIYKNTEDDNNLLDFFMREESMESSSE